MATRRLNKKKKKASKKASPKKPTGVKLVNPKDLDTKERPRRPSKFDPVAQALLKNPKKAVVVDVPKTSTAQVYRTMLYSRLVKCLNHFKPEHGKKVSISVLRDGNLGITLVAA